MAKTSRESFLETIREAAQAQPAEQVDLPEPADSVARLVSRSADLPGRLVQSLQDAGATPHRLGSEAELPDAVRAICQAHSLRTALADADAAIDPLVQAAEQAGLTVHRWSVHQNIEDAFDVDAGLTGVRFAVAETGSLVLASSPATGRMVSLAPLVHVALVREAQIVADLLDLFGPEGLGGSAMPSGAVLITGQSKTADIELNLVTGVHGPGFVHAIILP